MDVPQFSMDVFHKDETKQILSYCRFHLLSDFKSNVRYFIIWRNRLQDILCKARHIPQPILYTEDG